MKLGLLGAGGISEVVARAILDRHLSGIEVVAVAGSTATSERASRLASQLGVAMVEPGDLAKSGCEWVLEAAGGQAVRQHVPDLWNAGINTIIMSIGALIDPDVAMAASVYRSGGGQVLLPSGGIAGLDGIKAMAVTGNLRRCSITTTKSPAGLHGAPYLEKYQIELPTDRVVTVFEGTARDAVEGFPSNVNVAIALSLAGLGPDKTDVVIRSDPNAARTQHEIRAEADSALLELKVVSKPSPSNPKTSYLAALSAVAALRGIE